MNSSKLTDKFCAKVTQQWPEFATIKDLPEFTRAVLLAEICWVITIWMVKFSILAFYWRLFSGKSRSTRIAIWVLTVVITCWGTTLVRSLPSML